MRLEKIVSGGQTGADEGALAAAKAMGFETGGYMPKGFRTELGPSPELKERYGMVALPYDAYPPRTLKNVYESDATVWLDHPQYQSDSRGYLCTKRYVDRFGKPFIRNPSASQLREFLTRWDVRVLNVAGPRESRAPGIHHIVYQIITEAVHG